jgi:hypothetical protein
MRKILIAILLALNTSVAFAQPTAQDLAVGCGLPAVNCTQAIVDLTDGTFNGIFPSLSATQSLLASSETVAGAGSSVTDAAQLSATKIVHRITGANGTLGWKMSASMPINSVQILLNTTAGVAKIYAESGGTVNGGSADASFDALTGIKPIICVKTALLTYLCA